MVWLLSDTEAVGESGSSSVSFSTQLKALLPSSPCVFVPLLFGQLCFSLLFGGNCLNMTIKHGFPREVWGTLQLQTDNHHHQPHFLSDNLTLMAADGLSWWSELKIYDLQRTEVLTRDKTLAAGSNGSAESQGQHLLAVSFSAIALRHRHYTWRPVLSPNSASTKGHQPHHPSGLRPLAPSKFSPSISSFYVHACM